MASSLGTRLLVTRWGAVLASVLVLACSGGSNDSGGDTGRPQTPGPTGGSARATATSTPTVEEEVLAAYIGYWEAYAKALFDLDASHMEAVATGEQLNRVREEIERLRAQGLAGRVEVKHNAVVVQVSGNSAVLIDEMVNNSFYVDAKTKQPPVASGSGEVLKDTFYLQRISGTWVVTQSVRQR